MRIGYACLAVGVPDTELKSCTMKYASEERLCAVIEANLNALDHILDYNNTNNIRMFRISSDLIPFGSSPVNSIPWWKMFETQFRQLGDKIRKYRIRVSMHPGQYTVLNSPDPDIVHRAVLDLEYHTKVLDLLGVGTDSKIILHIGGVYQEKEIAIERFIENYKKLNDRIKARLIIENDDKSYHIEDLLQISHRLSIPVVYDNLHNYANPADQQYPDSYWINLCKSTWKEEDGPQKIHYSQQEPLKKAGSHSGSIRIEEFMEFVQSLGRDDIDIMLEVKDKNLSAVKCINCTISDQKIVLLEQEWSRYKYSVLEKSHAHYNAIRVLLKKKEDYPAVDFYRLLEETLQQPETIGNGVNGAMHVWGYFKDVATEAEKKRFLTNIEEYQLGRLSLQTVKNHLKRLAIKYQREYLIYSYYFTLT